VAVASAGPIEIAPPLALAPVKGADAGNRAPKTIEARNPDAGKPESKSADVRNANGRLPDAKPGTSSRTVSVTASVTAGSKAAASAAARTQEGIAQGGAGPAGPSVLTAAGTNLTMGFSSKPAGDLSTSRFTGPAVKPLATR
jgi:hypothetical protein